MKQVSQNRAEFLTDGIFAVVMTILVLDISVPQISSSHDAIDSVAAGTELAIGISFAYIELSIFVLALILTSAFMPNKIMYRMTFGALVGRK